MVLQKGLYMNITFKQAFTASILLGSSYASNAVAADFEPVNTPMVSGYLELFGQVGSEDYPGGGYSPWAGAGGNAVANVWMSPNFSMQFDLSGDALISAGDPDEYDLGVKSFAAHASYRMPDQYLFGGFIQYDVTQDYGSDGVLAGLVVGGEGVLFADNWTFYAQGGYLTGLHGENLDDSTYDYEMGFFNVEGRYFLNQNTRLDLGLGVLAGDYYTDSGYDATALTWLAGIEHRLEDSPFSLFARGKGFTVLDDGGNLDMSMAGVAEIGFKISLGATTLFEEDRSGATLKHSDALKFTNWMRWD